MQFKDVQRRSYCRLCLKYALDLLTVWQVANDVARWGMLRFWAAVFACSFTQMLLMQLELASRG